MQANNYPWLFFNIKLEIVMHTYNSHRPRSGSKAINGTPSIAELALSTSLRAYLTHRQRDALQVCCCPLADPAIKHTYDNRYSQAEVDNLQSGVQACIAACAVTMLSMMQQATAEC